jgi:hypothetical protein
MEDKQQDINSSHQRQVLIRRSFIVLAFILALAGVGFGTVYFLKNIAPKKDDTSKKSTSTLDSSGVIAAYKIAGLSDSTYRQEGGTIAAVSFKSEDHAYSVSASTDQVALFQAKAKQNKDDYQLIQDQTNTFMEAGGYQEVESQLKSVSGGPFYRTYQSGSTVCQLTDSGLNVPEGTLPYHMLACLEKTAIAKEYDVTEKILALYKKSNNLPVFTSASRSSVVEGDKSLMTFDLVGDNKNTKLLFAAIGDNWEYICNLSGSGGETSTKYVITAEAKKALQNPKYGDFLTHYILGGTR